MNTKNVNIKLRKLSRSCAVYGDKLNIEVFPNELLRSKADRVSADAASSSRGFIPGASSEVFARQNKHYTGGYYFLDIPIDGKKVEYWECEKCYNS